MSLSVLMNKALALQMHGMVHPAGHSTMCPERFCLPCELTCVQAEALHFPIIIGSSPAPLAGLGVPSHGLYTHVYTIPCVLFLCFDCSICTLQLR